MTSPAALALAAAMAGWAAAAAVAQDAPPTRPILAVENLRLSPAGSVEGDVVLKDGPAPPGGVVVVHFAWGDPDDPVTETVRAGGIRSRNRPRTVTTVKAFPCDATHPVTARAAPARSAGRNGRGGAAGDYPTGAPDGGETAGDVARAELTRTCTRISNADPAGTGSKRR